MGLDERYIDLSMHGARSLIDARMMINYELNRGMTTPEADMVRYGTDKLTRMPSGSIAGLQMSMFSSARDPVPTGIMTFEQLVRKVRDDDALADQIASLRRLSKSDYRKAKTRLPCITPGGVFRRRSIRALEAHSGFVMIDIDDLDDAASVRDGFERDPEVALAFVSPSGKGVKVLLAIDPLPVSALGHQAACLFVGAIVQRRTGMMVDTSGKDVSRLCFLGSDAHAVVNERFRRVRWTLAPVYEEPRLKADYGNRTRSEEERIAVSCLDAIRNASYDEWWQVSASLEGAFGADGFAMFDQWSASEGGEYDAERVKYQWDYRRSKGGNWGLGTLVMIAQNHGWEPPDDWEPAPIREEDLPDLW